jgi:hypothetical protein
MEQKIKETKRQHYVPQTYLKRFSSKRGKEYYINALPKNNCDINQIKELNIKNVCLEKGIYSLPFENTKKRMTIERFFSNEIESDYDKIYEILIDAKKMTITEEERAMIITTVVTMFLRTPFWKNTIDRFMKAGSEKTHLTCKQDNEDPLFLLDLLIAMSDLFNKRFPNDDICVIRIEGENELITSDHPVIPHNRIPIAPMNPENTLFLPIDNKHILCLLPNNNEIGNLTIFRRKIINNKEVECYNSMQKQFYERFLLGTKSSLLNV